MKKTISLVLAVLFAAIAVCTFAISAFAAPETPTTTTTKAADNDDVQGPTDPTTTTTAAATTTTTAATTTTTTASGETTTAAGTTARLITLSPRPVVRSSFPPLPSSLSQPAPSQSLKPRRITDPTNNQ